MRRLSPAAAPRPWPAKIAGTLPFLPVFVAVATITIEASVAETGLTVVSLPTGERDPAVIAASQLLQQQLANIPSSRRADVGAAYADLDGTGEPELIAQIESYDTCGSAGCMTWIFRNENGAWRVLINGTVAGSIGVYDRCSDQPLGMPRDLRFTAKEIWRWGPDKGYAPLPAPQ